MVLFVLLLGCTTSSGDSASPPTDSGPTDTGDPTVPPASCTAGHTALVADLGMDVAVSMRMEPATVDVDPAEPLAVSVEVTNVGAVALTGGWGGCVNASWRLADAAGTVVWEEPPEKSTCTQPPVDLAVGQTTRIAETLDLTGAPAGAHTLTARVAFQLDQGYFQDMSTWEVGAAVNVGVGACPDPHVEAFLGARPLRLGLSAPALPVDAAATTALSAWGSPDEALESQFGDCGLPRFIAVDAAGTELWTGSPADMMDCDRIEGWPADEVRSGTAEVPAGTWEAGVPATVGALFTETGDPAADLHYRVEIGIQTR